MSGPQPTMMQAIASKNCRNAGVQVLEETRLMEQNNGNGMNTSFYPTNIPLTDRHIYAGELLVTRRDTNSRPRDQHPHARSCVNGMLVSKADNDNDGGYAELSQNLIVLGFSIGDALWSDISPLQSGDPVAVISGYLSTRNTSLFPIQAGDAIMAVLPSFGRRPQLPMDNFAPMSKSRRVMETRPLQAMGNIVLLTDMKKLMKTDMMQSLMAVMLAPFMNLMMQQIPTEHDESEGAKIVRVLAAMKDSFKEATVKEVFNPDKHKDLTKGLVKMTCTELSKVRVDCSTPTVAEPALESMFKKLTPVSAMIASHFTSKMVGVAQTAAAPGVLFDIMATPATTSLLSEYLSEN